MPGKCRESPDPSSPHDDDDEPPFIGNVALAQTQHDTSPQQNDAVPPDHTQTRHLARQHAPPGLSDATPPGHAVSASATAVTTATTTIDVTIDNADGPTDSDHNPTTMGPDCTMQPGLEPTQLSPSLRPQLEEIITGVSL